MYDAGSGSDAGTYDAGSGSDGGTYDAGSGSDAGTYDAGSGSDAGAYDAGVDAPIVADAGVDAMPPDGCVPYTCDSLGADCGTHDDGCGGQLDCGPCECGFEIVPGGSVSFSKSFDKGVKLPVVGWRLGGDAKVSLGGNVEGAACANGCKAKLAVEGGGEIGVWLKDKLKVGIQGSYEAEREYCQECNEETCETECTDLKCTTQSLSLAGTVSYEKYFGMKKFQLGPWGPLKFSFKCGAGLELSANGGFGGEVTSAGTCQPCPECLTWKGSGGAGFSTPATCAIQIDAWSYHKEIGCQGCAAIYGDVGVEVKQQECQGGLCAEVKGKAGVRVLGQACMGWGWFQAFVSCGGKAEGRAKYNSCGDSSFTPILEGWCNVTNSCPANCVCCDGSESPSCNPDQGSWGGCCSSHGGICDPRCMP